MGIAEVRGGGGVDAAKQAGVLVAPPLWYGESTHHMGFSGTLTLQVETMIAVVNPSRTSTSGRPSVGMNPCTKVL